MFQLGFDIIVRVFLSFGAKKNISIGATRKWHQYYKKINFGTNTKKNNLKLARFFFSIGAKINVFIVFIIKADFFGGTNT